MFVLVSYDADTRDADGRKRLRNIARICQNWGQRVQFSVFRTPSRAPRGRVD